MTEETGSEVAAGGDEPPPVVPPVPGKRTRKRPEEALLKAVHAGIKTMADGFLSAGRALAELREGPRKDLTREQWDTWLRAEFGITHATASKWMTMAAFPVPQLDDGVSIWKHMPPKWTSQYALVSQLEPDQVAKAITSGEIHPAMTGPDVVKVVRAATGKSAKVTDTSLIAVRVEKGSAVHLLCQAIDGAVSFADDDVNAFAAVLAKVLNETQRAALRDLLADERREGP